MLSGLTDLLAATAAFVLGHLMLSSQPLRTPLVDRLGEGGFRAFYSVMMLAAFVWMLLAYGRAPRSDLWFPPDWVRWVAVALMPLASLLVVGGLTTASPTLVGGDKAMDKAGSRTVVQGFLTVSRHSFLCGTALWALLHLLANGDDATIVLAGGILVLSLAGMWHIDQRRQVSLGAAWGPIQLTTSRLPFLAALQGRTRIDWRGIGWWRPLLALVVYLLLLFGHPHIAGAPVIYF
jgi:uncharacterized membrane protein